MNLTEYADRVMSERVERMRAISGHHPLKDFTEEVIGVHRWSNEADLEEVWAHFVPNKRFKSTALKYNQDKRVIEYNPYRIDELLKMSKKDHQLRLTLYKRIGAYLSHIFGYKIH